MPEKNPHTPLTVLTSAKQVEDAENVREHVVKSGAVSADVICCTKEDLSMLLNGPQAEVWKMVERAGVDMRRMLDCPHKVILADGRRESFFGDEKFAQLMQDIQKEWPRTYIAVLVNIHCEKYQDVLLERGVNIIIPCDSTEHGLRSALEDWVHRLCLRYMRGTTVAKHRLWAFRGRRKGENASPARNKKRSASRERWENPEQFRNER